MNPKHEFGSAISDMAFHAIIQYKTQKRIKRLSASCEGLDGWNHWCWFVSMAFGGFFVSFVIPPAHTIPSTNFLRNRLNLKLKALFDLLQKIGTKRRALLIYSYIPCEFIIFSFLSLVSSDPRSQRNGGGSNLSSTKSRELRKKQVWIQPNLFPKLTFQRCRIQHLAVTISTRCGKKHWLPNFKET